MTIQIVSPDILQKDLLRGSYYVYTRTYFFKWLMQGSTILCMPNVRTKIVCMFQPRTYIFRLFLNFIDVDKFNFVSKDYQERKSFPAFKIMFQKARHY
jgi:hypothetical protein